MNRLRSIALIPLPRLKVLGSGRRWGRRLLLAFLLVVMGLATSYGAWLATSSTPQRVLLDFENGVRGQVIDDEYTHFGVQIRAVNWSHGPDVAALFDSEFVTGSDEDLESPIPPGPGFEALGELAPGKVLILHEQHDCTDGICTEPDDEGSRPAGWLELVFSEPVTLVQLDVLDVTYEDGETPSQLVLYGTEGVLPGEWLVPDVGNHRWGRWDIGASGVTRARLYLPGDGAVDNIVFERPSASVNWAPEIGSQPVIGVRSEEPYAYALDVADLDGDAAIHALLTAPTGMYITAEGVLRWTPGATDVGTHAVEVEVDDGRGGTARQAFSLTVSDEALSFTLDFEDLDLGRIVDREYVDRGVFIRAKNLSSGSDYAVVFDSGQPTGGDTDLSAPFEEEDDYAIGIGDLDPGKLLILHEEHDCDVEDQYCLEPDDETSHPAGWIEFRFAQPAHVLSLDVFDITSDDPAARTVELYDANDQPLSSGLVLPYTGSSDWARLRIDTQGVRRMRVNLDGDGALDNLRYALVGTVEPENQPPVARDDDYQVEKGGVLAVPAPGVLANDSDSEGNALVAALENEPDFGFVNLNPDGSFVYTPGPEFSGRDVFQYRAYDGQDASIAVDVNIDVIAPPGQALIHDFTVAPDTIVAGNSAILSWSVSQAETIRIDPGVGDVPNLGSHEVTPSATTTYTLTATGTDGIPITSSRVLTVEAAPPPVSIAIIAPANGVLLDHDRPEIRVRYVQPGSGIDFTSLILTANSVALDATCTHDVDESRCLPAAGLPEGDVSLSARVQDTVGSASNVASVGFSVDSIPPAAPDASKISVSPPDGAGQVAVTGAAGAAEPNAQAVIRNALTGHQVLAAIDAQGAFTGQVPGQAGNSIRVAVQDAAGHVGPTLSFTVPQPPFDLTVSSPAAGSTVDANVVDVVGLHNGPFGTAVTVNGSPAAVDDGSFHAGSVSIYEGENTIQIVGTTPGGQSKTVELVLYGSATSPPPLLLIADLNAGPATHRVRFTLAGDVDPAAVRGIEIDFDNDGAVDERHVDFGHRFVYEYTQAGVHHPTVHVLTTSETLSASTTIVVQEVAHLDALLRQTFSTFQNALAAGDFPSAYGTMTGGARARYQPLFEAFPEAIQQGASSYSEPLLIEMSALYATYLVTRDQDGKTYGYEVKFARSHDGTWKISSM